MTRIAVVGGHGQIGTLLVTALKAAGHEPVAIGRNEQTAASLMKMHDIETRLLDLESADASGFADSLAGCDAVVFSAGGGPDGNIERKRSVDLEGALKTIEAARRLGLSRYVQISAIGVDQAVAADVSDVWAAYVAAKRDSDAAVRASGLDWTILRPGTLTDGPSSTVSIGVGLPHRAVPRASVADVAVAVLGMTSTIGHQWDVTEGADTVSEALGALV